MALRRKVVRKYQRYLEARQAKFVEQYLAENPALKQVISEADKASSSTGADAADYVALYEFVRSRKPQTVLELGTGRSTWVIAEALKQVFGGKTEGIKLVSMEHNKAWFEHARSIFPSQYADVAELCYSPMTYQTYSFLRGTVYEAIPDHPYELVFVDGPDQEFFHDDGTKENVCNLDFLRLVQASERPITALIDNRRHTVLAYTLLFGPDKVTFYESWDLGVVEGVTRDDLVLNDKNIMNKHVFKHLAHIEQGALF